MYTIHIIMLPRLCKQEKGIWIVATTMQLSTLYNYAQLISFSFRYSLKIQQALRSE